MLLVLVIVWSAVSIFMGAHIYLEVQNQSDLVSSERKPLLSRFPLHTTLCCNKECNRKSYPIPDGLCSETSEIGVEMNHLSI